MENTWITFVAQIVNFLILVFLLKYFLYGRILGAMEKREDGIARNLEEAGRKKTEAEEEAAEFRKKSDELERNRGELIAEATGEAQSERKRLIDSARAEADELGARWKESVRQEKAAFYHELRRRISKQVCEVAASALSDMANADIEARMIDIFLGRLKNLPDDERNELVESVKKAGNEVKVAGAFEIPEAKKSEIREAVGAAIGVEADVAFVISEKLICGIELGAGGTQVAWTIESYLESLEKSLAGVIEETVMQEA